MRAGRQAGRQVPEVPRPRYPNDEQSWADRAILYKISKNPSNAGVVRGNIQNSLKTHM